MIKSDKSFNQAINVAEKLNRVYDAAYQYRFMNVCGKEPLISAKQWKMKNAINKLMETI